MPGPAGDHPDTPFRLGHGVKQGEYPLQTIVDQSDPDPGKNAYLFKKL